jgi:hypothetical protein
MNSNRKIAGFAASCALVFASGASAFDSGSTGADGPFSPTENVTVPLPPSGIFNFTTVDIPGHVTVKFQRNAANTPVVILASGNVVIAGVIQLDGAFSPLISNFEGEGLAGEGGPGGHSGGRGGVLYGTQRGGNGLGVGGGGGGGFDTIRGYGGGGGGYLTEGGPGAGEVVGGAGGVQHGTAFLQPLIGGAGGGGGGASEATGGAGGGGGGGAILIASSGFVDIIGRVQANGGGSGNVGGVNNREPGCGGGGSGGSIRIVGSAVRGTGQLVAEGNQGGCSGAMHSGNGSHGRIRVEAEKLMYASLSNIPAPSFGTPQPLFLAGQPGLRITSVAGVAAPAVPGGNMDVTLPVETTNPITVLFETSGIPVGATISLKVTPQNQAPITAESAPTTGTTSSATASTSVTIPTGHSVFQATVSYTLAASVGNALSRFAKNERVERITLTATFGSPTRATLVTASGKEYDAPAHVLRIAAGG